jgi:hypothetical protein
MARLSIAIKGFLLAQASGCRTFTKYGRVGLDAPAGRTRFSRFAWPSAQPNFCAELGGIVNVESLIKPFGLVRDRRELDPKFIRDHRLRLAQGELNANFDLRWSGAAFPQDACSVRNGMLAQFDRFRRNA